jgi:hypothetical protein
MGADAPIPPIVMSAAAPGGAPPRRFRTVFQLLEKVFRKIILPDLAFMRISPAAEVPRFDSYVIPLYKNAENP